MRLNWTLGNAKLEITGKKRRAWVVGFGLPAVQTCPGAGPCRAICYATQGSYQYPVVRDSRQENWESSKRSDFAALLQADLAELQAKADRNGRRLIVRVHDSGDFYSSTYLATWLDAARATPRARFYAYTKSLHLLTGLQPDNFVLVQSLGGLHDGMVHYSKPHARIFATHAARRRAGYLDGTKSDWPAIDGKVRIGLVYHGARNLTAAQASYFG